MNDLNYLKEKDSDYSRIDDFNKIESIIKSISEEEKTNKEILRFKNTRRLSLIVSLVSIMYNMRNEISITKPVKKQSIYCNSNTFRYNIAINDYKFSFNFYTHYSHGVENSLWFDFTAYKKEKVLINNEGSLYGKIKKIFKTCDSYSYCEETVLNCHYPSSYFLTDMGITKFEDFSVYKILNSMDNNAWSEEQINLNNEKILSLSKIISELEKTQPSTLNFK